SGKIIELGQAVQKSIGGTKLYRPDELDALVANRPLGNGGTPKFEVTNEPTQHAARRFYLGGQRVVALNFASAKNPGGGFLGGARAQEEDMARSSALYNTLLT